MQAGDRIAEVVGPDPMLAVGSVGERERGHLVNGQTASLRFIDGLTRTGAVSFVGMSSDKATHTYRVEARMPNADASIARRRDLRDDVSLEPIEAAPIPRSALVFSDDGRLACASRTRRAGEVRCR